MGSRFTILVVDDSPAILNSIGNTLSSLYSVKVANSGERALSSLSSQALPDLILLDVMMPDLNGYDVLIKIQEMEGLEDIPVIFVTGMNDETDEEHGFALGAVDYVTKPIRPAVLLARVKTHLELKSTKDTLKSQNELLALDIKNKIKENALIRDIGMKALSSLAKTRDNETGNHILRTQNYVKILAEKLVENDIYTEQLPQSKIDCIVQAAPLHDIGKVGIPDAILLKPGKLTEAEFKIMQQHSTLGADALLECIKNEAEDDALSFIYTSIEIARYHHEKWDGSGYPKGIAEEGIPISARLMALADVFDALITRRCYKPAFSLAQSTDIIVQGSGTHFDPNIVAAFEQSIDQFNKVALQYIDEFEELEPASVIDKGSY